MSNSSWWIESPSKRLALWKEFRQGLDTTDTEKTCQAVVSWWESAPLVNIAIDPDDYTNWPTPWEMLHQGDFCENSLALGMAYTIFYADQNIKTELMFITDKKNSFQKLCVLIEDNYLLNYQRGMISNFTDLKDVSFSYRINVNQITE